MSSTSFINFFITLGDQRLLQYRLVFAGLGDHWLLGNGIGSFQERFSFRYDVHNALLQILNWGGVVSLALFGAVWIYPLVRLVSSSREWGSHRRAKIRAVYIMMILSMLVSIQFFGALNSSVFFMMWGAISAIPYMRPSLHPNDLHALRS